MSNQHVKSINIQSVADLVPTNGRKSFYGKAKVMTIEGVSFLQSYDTIMASVSGSDVKRYSDSRSNTTSTHIKSFLDRYYPHDGNIKTVRDFYKLDLAEKPTILIKM